MSEIKTVLNFFDKNNGLAGVIKDLKEVKKLQAEINKQKGGVGSDNLKERAAALKEIARLQKLLDAARKKGNETKKKSLTIEQQLVKIQEQDKKVKDQLIIARSKEFKQLQESKVALQQKTKAVKAENTENSKLSSEYDKQSAKLNRLRKSLKNLILTEGEGSKKTKKLALEVGKLDTRLKAADAAAGQFQRSVGNYPNALKGAIGGLKNLAGALGITAGIAGLVRGIGSAINVFKDFEKANSNLKAVLNGTDEEMKALSDSAKELGSTTAFTASEVTELNIALAKLGFPTEDILQMNEAILSGAAAMGSDLGETATLVGATLRSFGLDASESGRVVDVLSKSTSASALDFAKLNASMSTIAPVANKFGFSLEGTTALLGQLSNAGFDASSAATATRNILLNLADSNGKLSKSLKEPVKDLPSLVRGLEQLKSEGVDLGAALELTDKRSVAAFATFLEGTDSVLALNDALENSGGTAEKMADTQLDNLAGSITILSSAWEGFILSLEDGNNAFGRILRAIVDVTTELLSLLGGFAKAKDELNETQLATRELAESIIKVGKVLGITLASFLAYKTAVIATNLATKAYTFVTTALRVAKIALSRGTNIATIAMKAFNLATKANPIGLLIALVTAAAGAFFFFRDEQDKATTSTVEFTSAQLEAIDAIKERLKITESAGKIFNKLIKDETAFLGGFSDAQIKSTILETRRIAIKKKGTEQAAIAIRILNRLEEEQSRRKAEQTELDVRNVNDLIEVQLALLKLAKAKDGSTEANIASRNKEIDVINKEIKRLQELGRAKEDELRTDKDIAKAKELAAKDAEALRKANLADEEAADKKEQDRFDKHAERQQNAFDIEEAHARGLIAEKERNRLKEEEIEKKRKEAQQELITQSKEAVDFAIDDLTRESQARIEALDRRINAEKDFLSENENLSAHEIELRRKKQVELEAERIEEQKRLEKLAKTQAFFDLVAAFASSGDGQGAVGKAATAMAAAEVLSQGFHDGGYTGDGNEHKEAGVVHKGEFVNTKKQTSEYGMKGWTAKDFDGAVKDGYFNQFTDSNMFADQNAKFLSVQNNQVGYDFNQLKTELVNVKEAISNIQSSDFAIQDGYFIKTKHSKGSTLVTKKKLG